MARAIDYGLNVRQAAINNYMNAVANRAQKKAEADARAEKAARQKRKGLMTLALHAGAAVATGGASLPYSAKYGAFANKALMGDDYEGSGVDALQGLGSAVYAGAEQSKAKQLAGMEKSYNNQLESIYASIDALPESQVMERARLANQARALTNRYEDQLDVMNKKPAHEFLGSEREKMTMRIPTASGSATPAQISTGTKVEEVEEAISGGGPTSEQIDQIYSGMEVPKENDFESTQKILQGEANRREGLMNITQDKAGFGRGELSDKAGGFGRYQTNLAQEVSQEEVDRRNRQRSQRFFQGGYNG